MATSDSREVVIEATPKEILGVIADVETSPDWTPQQQSVEILERGEDGKPRRVKMKVKTAGISDEQIVEYTWTDDSASWTLVSAGQLKSQDAKYTLTREGDKTKVKFELTIDPSVPLPRVHPEAGDKGRDGDRDRRVAQAGAERPEGRRVRASGGLTAFAGMAVRASREVVIDASPEAILDVLADIDMVSTRSPLHKHAEVLDRYPDGRPHHVKTTLKIMGHHRQGSPRIPLG